MPTVPDPTRSSSAWLSQHKAESAVARPYKSVVWLAVARPIAPVKLSPGFRFFDDIAYAAVGSEDLAKLVGFIAALLIAERFVVIEPCVAQVNIFVNFIEGLGRYDGDAELIRVQHHVGVVFKQRRIVRQRDRARYFKPGKLIADRKAVIFKIQPVGGYLALLWAGGSEHVGLIYLAAVFENAHGVFVIERCFLVKKLMHRNVGGFKPRSRPVRQLILKDEVAAFDIVFFKACVDMP